MPWSINSIDGQQRCPAPAGETVYIVAGDSGLAAVHATPDSPSLILGTLAVQSYGAKLEAGSEDFRILPAPTARLHSGSSSNPPAEGFVLQAKSDNRVETIILRNQDKITAVNTSGGLTFTWSPPQIQVQSSEKKESPATSGDVVQAENETEDEDEDLDNTVVPGVGKSETMRSTPHLSASRSEIIQETPTIDRVAGAVGLPSRTAPLELKNDDSNTAPPAYSTAPQEQSIVNDLTKTEEPTDAEMGDTETTSEDNDPPTQESRQSKVQSSKRQSQALDDEPSSPSAHLSKRRKVEKASDVSATPVQTARKAATRSKGRASSMKAEPSPSRSQRSTQSSRAGSVVDVEGDYDGPKPRVALSNSTIPLNTYVVRTLKKMGGSVVDSVEGECNILCIKEGPILKTTKLLQAIARGTPIVNDKWLLDSTQASRFLPLELYKPPDLEPVWKIPQSRLLEGFTIFFTPALKAHYKTMFTDMDKLCKAVGARRVVSKKPSGKDLTDAKSLIFLAEAEGDKDLPALLDAGHACYTKDFLTHSIIVGEVDLSSEEFRIQPSDAKPAKKKGRGRNG